MLWSEFRSKAFDDLRIAERTYNSKDYANSAYHSQQAIEKLVKSFVIKHDLSSKPVKKLGHMPLVKLFDELAQKTEGFVENVLYEEEKKEYKELSIITNALCNFFKKALGQEVTQPQNMMSSINSVEKDFFENSTKELKIIWWKYSLKISRTPDEAKKLEKIFAEFNDLLPQIRTISSALLTSSAANKLAKQPRRVRREFQRSPCGKLLKQLENLKEIKIETQNDVDILAMQELAFFDTLEKLCKDVLSNKSKQYSLEPDMVVIILLGWVFRFSMLILEISPHEDLGRYPETVAGKSVEEWYTLKHKNLYTLETEIKRACQRLDFMLNGRHS